MMGGDLQIVETTDLQTHSLPGGVSYAPFNGNLAVNYNDKVIYVARERLFKKGTVGGIIHEMGHVFAMRERPLESREQYFAGWENQVSIITDCRREWLRQMNYYYIQLDNGEHDRISGDWDTFNWKTRNEWMRAMIELGKTYGNLSQNGLPLCVR